MKRKIIKKEMTLSEMRQKRAELDNFQSEKFHRHSENEFIRAIKLSDGYQTRVAKLLGITCGAVSQRIKKSEKLQEVLDEILQGTLDLAEVKLVEAINNSQPWAVQFILRSKGRKRGWGEKSTVEIETKQGGVLVVYPQVEDHEEWSRGAVLHQRKLLGEGTDIEEGEVDEEEKYQDEESKFIESAFNTEGS